MGFNLDLGTVSDDGTGLLPARRNAPLGPDRRGQWLSLRSQLESVEPTVELFESDNFVSFAFDDLAIVLNLFEDGADLEIPSTSGDDEQTRWLAIGELIRFVQGETSWSLFNPQTDRIETVEEMLAGSGVFPQLLQAAMESQSAPDVDKTRSKRKRLFRKKR